jgi:5,10-methylene-tetrahydrofolate dehydrogenase/methenyl tetrahydrofolate cyclohydrolase
MSALLICTRLPGPPSPLSQHSKPNPDRNAEEVVRSADIVVAACGRAEMVKGSWIKPGAC